MVGGSYFGSFVQGSCHLASLFELGTGAVWFQLSDPTSLDGGGGSRGIGFGLGWRSFGASLSGSLGGSFGFRHRGSMGFLTVSSFRPRSSLGRSRFGKVGGSLVRDVLK